jgi:RNA polymerase sigma factor (sigma-70 family)
VNINELYTRAIRDEAEAQDLLFRELRDMFSLFIRQWLRDPSTREDLVQNALMKIARSYRQVEIKSSFASWARRVLRNEIIDHYRVTNLRQLKWAEITEEDFPVEQREPDMILKEKLRDCLKELIAANPRYARVLALHYQGYKTPEICARLQVKESYCRVLLRRARAQLAKCLNKGDLGYG